MFQGPPALIVDVETTGVDPRRDRVVEIACVLTDWKDTPYAVLSTYVDPGYDFGKTPVSGIEYADVREGPTFKELLAQGAYGLFLVAELYVAHQARFDLSFLRSEFELAGFRLPARTVYDTYGVTRTSLEAACGRHGVHTTDVVWHSALGDCVATYRLARKLRSSTTPVSQGGDFSLGIKMR